MSDTLQPSGQDPSLTAGSQLVSPELRAQFVQLIHDPNSMPDAERQAALKQAGILSTQRLNSLRFVENKDGEPRKAYEYPDVFAFDGQMRGRFDVVPSDTSKWNQDLQLASVGGHLDGRVTDVIFETDDGDTILIKRTNDVKSAKHQTFSLISTRAQRKAAEAGEEYAPKEIDSTMLKNVIAVPGEPLKLGVDPNTGKAPQTRGAVTRIVGLDMNEGGKIGSKKTLADASIRIDVVDKFNESMKEAKRAGTVAKLGKTALGTVANIV